jgi:maltooligosyltrehalose trehalohydrolase
MRRASPDPALIMSQTYSNCAGRNGLLDRARDMARWNYVSQDIAQQLDPEFLGFPNEFRNLSLANPSQSRLFNTSNRTITRVSSTSSGSLRSATCSTSSMATVHGFTKGSVIALYTAKGIPMLWKGQEFGENWGVPRWGTGRNLFERRLHWEYFL